MLEQTSEDRSATRNSSLQSCKVIFDITLRRTILSKKTRYMLMAMSLPVLLAVYYRIHGASESPGPVLSTIMSLLFLQFLLVLVALLYASAIVADEVDSRTIICLFTRPVRRYSIIAGKFMAYMLEAPLILIIPMLLTYLIIATGNGIFSNPLLSLGNFGKQICVTILALVAYGAIFAFLGTWSKRPVVLGLLFAFGWEKIVFMVPGVIRKFSVIHYLMSIFPGGKAMKGFRMHLPPGVIPDSSLLSSVVTLLIIGTIFLALTIFTIYRKEYRFE